MLKKTIGMILILSLLLTSAFSAYASAEQYNCENNIHKLVLIKNVPPTETENGEVVYKCDLCSEEVSQVMYATGHNWSEWETTKEPTCTEAGLQYRHCTIGAPHGETKELAALGHAYKETVTNADCLHPGEKKQVCSRCEDTKITEIPVTKEHNYEETITQEASCTHNGVKTIQCKVCKHSYTETIMAFGHNFGEWIIDTPPQIDIAGSQHQDCLNGCGKTITASIDPLPPEPQNSSFGSVEIAIVAGNISLFIALWFILKSEFFFLNWIKRRKLQILADKSDDLGGVGFELI